MSGYVHIYAPPVVDRRILSGTCLDCKKRTRFLTFCYEWHGATSTCMRCGRRWCEGEWQPLEFERGIRKRNVESAKRNWRRLSTPPQSVSGGGE